MKPNFDNAIIKADAKVRDRHAAWVAAPVGTPAEAAALEAFVRASALAATLRMAAVEKTAFAA